MPNNRTHKKIAIHCLKCEGKNTIKSGKVNGKQRFFCKSCNYYFTIHHRVNTPTVDLINEAYKLYIKGYRITDISEITYIPDSTIYKWMRPPYCLKKQNQWNPFAKVGSNKDLLEQLDEFINLEKNSYLKLVHYAHQSSLYYLTDRSKTPRYLWKKVLTFVNPRTKVGITHFILEFNSIYDWKEFEYFFPEFIKERRVTSSEIPYKVKNVTIDELIDNVFGAEISDDEFGLDYFINLVKNARRVVLNKKGKVSLSKL